MGGKICSECTHQKPSQIQVSAIHPLLQLATHDDPSPQYARMENVKYEVPCDVNHLLSEIPAVQYDKQLERGKKIENAYYLIPYSVYYTGQWKKGLPHGVGDVVFENGSVLKGTFQKGKAKGKDCILVMQDGSYYRGNIENNQFCGRGILTQANGHVYDGYWENNVPHGEGRQQFANGDSFEGTYQNGKKKGNKCSYKWAKHPQFIEYRGGFNNDQMSGEGVLTKKNSTITGIFRNCDIQDAIIKSEKFEYRGQIKNGLLHGDGKMFNRDLGTTYQGQFKNGQPHGEGTIQLPSGQKKTGMWFKGNLIKDYKGLTDEELQACIDMVEQEIESKIYAEDAVESMNLRLKSAGYENFVAELVDNTNVSKSALSGNRYLVVNMGPKTLQIKPK